MDSWEALGGGHTCDLSSGRRPGPGVTDTSRGLWLQAPVDSATWGEGGTEGAPVQQGA